MALSQLDVDALDAAIVGAELEVEVDGRRVRFRTVSELLKARDHAVQVLQAPVAGARRTGGYRFTMTTGRE